MKILATLKKSASWAIGRAKERSTYVGLAMIAAAAGKSVLADQLTDIGNIVPMILGVGGAALAAASTRAAAPTV